MLDGVLLTALVVLVTFCILVGAEYLSRSKDIHAELTRKLVHVAVGTFVAFWPFFLSWRQIQLLSLAFFAVVCVSIKFNIFNSIHAVKRSISGELLFAIVIGLLALIATDKWVFMAAMLHLSLADGLAAVVGLGWGGNNSYKVFGRTKSIAGSAAFLVTSVAILVVYAIFSNSTTSFSTYVWLPVLAVVTENLAVQGTDNLIMPMVIAFVLVSGA
jgi:phytol kinase